MALESTIAGSWYPGAERAIRDVAAKWEAASTHDKGDPTHIPNVLVLPHAGWRYSGETAWSAVRAVRGAKFSRVVVLAPSHRAFIENRLVAPESDAVATPLGEIKIDRDWLDRLSLLAPVMRNDSIHLAEHSAQIEFPLLQLALGSGFFPCLFAGFGMEPRVVHKRGERCIKYEHQANYNAQRAYKIKTHLSDEVLDETARVYAYDASAFCARNICR